MIYEVRNKKYYRFYWIVINGLIVIGMVGLSVLLHSLWFLFFTFISLKELYFYIFRPYKILISIEIEKNNILFEFANGEKINTSPNDLTYTKMYESIHFFTIEGVDYPMNKNLKDSEAMVLELAYVCSIPN